jgi:hypothetical protein
VIRSGLTGKYVALKVEIKGADSVLSVIVPVALTSRDSKELDMNLAQLSGLSTDTANNVLCVRLHALH